MPVGNGVLLSEDLQVSNIVSDSVSHGTDSVFCSVGDSVPELSYSASDSLLNNKSEHEINDAHHASAGYNGNEEHTEGSKIGEELV